MALWVLSPLGHISSSARESYLSYMEMQQLLQHLRESKEESADLRSLLDSKKIAPSPFSFLLARRVPLDLQRVLARRLRHEHGRERERRGGGEKSSFRGPLRG